MGWMHLWQARLAGEALQKLGHEPGEKGFHIDKKTLSANAEVAYYLGKVQGATFYMHNSLPQVAGLASTVQNLDLSLLEMAEESFASP